MSGLEQFCWGNPELVVRDCPLSTRNLIGVYCQSCDCLVRESKYDNVSSEASAVSEPVSCG